MANRTISLSPMCDLIRKQLVETKGIPFSMWVSNQLVEWNRTTRKEEQEAKAVKPPVPFNIFELDLIGQLTEKNRGGIVSLIPWK